MRRCLQRPSDILIRVLTGFLLLLCAAPALAQTPDELIASSHVRIRAWLEPVEVLVGQRATLRVQVMTRSWYLEAPAFPANLEVPDAVVLRPDAFATNSRERLDGASYTAQTRSYSIFPVASGTLEIPEVEVGLVVARDDASPSDPIVLSSESLQLKVSIAEAARGHGLVVAVPALEFRQEWTTGDGEHVVGDAITRTITQTVSDSVAMVLQQPQLSAPPGVAIYPTRPELNTRSSRGLLEGSRKDSVSYVLEKEGHFDLPPVEFLWWDLSSDTLRHEVLPGLDLEVGANPDLAAEHLAAAVDEEERTDDTTHSTLPWRHIGLVGALLAALLLGLRGIRKRNAAGALRTRTDPDRETRAWKRLVHSARRGDSASTFAALMAWVDSHSPGSTWREVLEDSPDALRTDIEQLEAAVFGQAGHDATTSKLVKRLRPVRRDLQRSRTPQVRRASGALRHLNPAGPKG